MSQFGSFGIFSKSSSQRISDAMKADWMALEDVCYSFWFIGIYSAYDVIQFGRNSGLLTSEEYDCWFNLLQN
jgi:hypothetical protein